jgi:Trypsin-co-occurring domain 1
MGTIYLPINVNGNTVYIEAEATQVVGSQPTSGGFDRVLKEAPDTFVRAQQTVKSIAVGMVSAIKEIHTKLAPEEFEIEIALKFTAEGNVVLTKLGGEAQIMIHLTYRQSEESNACGE